MSSFHEEVSALIGEQLRVIGATHIRDMQSGEGFDAAEVCFFSAADKIIAIVYSPRNGASCFIVAAESAQLALYETWDSLWHLLVMDEHLDTDEELSAYLDSFPKGQEYIEYMGACLVKYFGSSRAGS